MKDKGTDNLINDLIWLGGMVQKMCSLAVKNEFHDFKNQEIAAPKIELNTYLESIKQFCADRQRALLEGSYDNEPDTDDEAEMDKLILTLPKEMQELFKKK